SEANSRSHAWFPLTPTLSLGERGRPCAAFGDSEGCGSSRDGKWFSLSPRERVGVRGKCAFHNLPPAVVEDPCKEQRGLAHSKTGRPLEPARNARSVLDRTS